MLQFYVCNFSYSYTRYLFKAVGRTDHIGFIKLFLARVLGLPLQAKVINNNFLKSRITDKYYIACIVLFAYM